MEFVREIQENPYLAVAIMAILQILGYWIVCLAFDEEDPHDKR